MASRINAKLGKAAVPLPVIITWLEALLTIMAACQTTPEKAATYLRNRKAFRTRRILKEMKRQWANYESEGVNFDLLSKHALEEVRGIRDADLKTVYADLSTTAG